jgi:predicted metal-dependent hydrolase
MSTEQSVLTIRGLKVDVARKDIKNLHLGVYPPNGRVRVAAPLNVSDDAVRLAVIGKLAWIRRQRQKFIEQHRQTEREAVTGESHYVFGRRYRLNVVDTEGRQQVVLRTKTRKELHVRAGATADQRLAVLERWYRRQLRETLEPILTEWQATIGVTPKFWGIKRMKTKWGACNAEDRRIWLNSELAKKPIGCIEYIVVHELVHLLEPSHNAKFIELMDRFLSDWRSRRDHLNSSPLANESWTY